jgi:hypothetical protein
MFQWQSERGAPLTRAYVQIGTTGERKLQSLEKTSILILQLTNATSLAWIVRFVVFSQKSFNEMLAALPPKEEEEDWRRLIHVWIIVWIREEHGGVCESFFSLIHYVADSWTPVIAGLFICGHMGKKPLQCCSGSIELLLPGCALNILWFSEAFVRTGMNICRQEVSIYHELQRQ